MAAIIIPTLNEEKAVSKVISDFKAQGFRDVYVIDGGSEDRTVDVAKRAGAKVIMQKGQGKGDALRQALKDIDADIYVTVDADDTYEASKAGDLVELIKSGKCDMAVGKRSVSEIPFSTGSETLFSMR